MAKKEWIDEFLESWVRARRNARRREEYAARKLSQDEPRTEPENYWLNSDALLAKIAEHGRKWQKVHTKEEIERLAKEEWLAERAAYEARCKEQGVSPEGGGDVH